MEEQTELKEALTRADVEEIKGLLRKIVSLQSSGCNFMNVKE